MDPRHGFLVGIWPVFAFLAMSVNTPWVCEGTIRNQSPGRPPVQPLRTSGGNSSRPSGASPVSPNQAVIRWLVVYA